MICHEIDYQIHGGDLQFVEVELDPYETVVAEAGAMMYMEEGISFETKMGDGSTPKEGLLSKLFSAGKRYMSGETIFMTHFTNIAQGKKHVAFAANVPGRIVPIDMAKLSGDLLCQKDSFLCAALGTKLDMAFMKRFGVGLFGGEGFILQRLKGDGMAFLSAGGMVIEKELRGETLLVDTGCIVAFEEVVDYSIQKAGSLKSMVFGGEGIFLATLKGNGKVWLQSIPFSKLADNIVAHSPALGGSSQGRGSILGGFGQMFER